MNLATLHHDEETSTWSAVFNDEVIVKSIGGESSRKYVIDRILSGKCGKAVKLNVTGFSNLNVANRDAAVTDTSKPWVPTPPRIKPNNQLSVAERYELLDECVDIILRPETGIRSLIITGEGSVGKTFHTKERIKAAGLKSSEEAMEEAHTLLPEEEPVAAMIRDAVQACCDKAVAYFKENGLPPLKKLKGEKAEDDEDDGDGDEGADPPQSPAERMKEFVRRMKPGQFDFTTIHNSRDVRDRRVAASFSHGFNRYKFNIKLAAKNVEETIEMTVPHEVGHHVHGLLYPHEISDKKKSHGKNWRFIQTAVFGIPDEVTHNMDLTDMAASPDLAGDYHYVKGYSSAKGLYRMLFENRRKIVILDDADSAWKNEVSANILKAALDSDEDRWITWQVEQGPNDDLPRRFLFEGKVIFISNVASEDFPQPLVSRALRCDVELTMDERFERMSQILESPKFAPGVPLEIRKMAFDFLYENREYANEISTRSLLNVTMVANSGSKLWKRIALANIS